MENNPNTYKSHFVLAEQHIYGSSRNHLGNVQATINGGGYTKSSNIYYPFGMLAWSSNAGGIALATARTSKATNTQETETG